MSMILLIAAAYLAILFGAEGLYRFTKVPPEWTRKLQHVVSGLLAAYFPWIFSSPKEVFALGLIMAVVLLALRKSRLLTSMHEVKRKTFGEFYFVLAIVFLSIFAWNTPLIYLISTLTLTVSDTLAAIVGTAHHKITYSIKGHTKSVEGSTVFLICTFLIVLVSLLSLSELSGLASSLVAVNLAFLVTLVEAVCRNGRDNLFIPLAAYWLLNRFIGFSEIRLLQVAGGCLSIALLIVYFFHKYRAFSLDSFPPEDSRISYFRTLRQHLYGLNAPLDPVHPEAVCMVALRGQIPMASVTIQRKGDMGLIGHYEAISKQAGVFLLRKAREKLLELGAKEILGPMNGNTWNRYRLALDETNPFFIGEPRNPASYHDHFIGADFSVVERYESRIATDLLKRESAYLRLGAKMAKLGISVRSLDPGDFENTLQEIYALSLPAFSQNRFYEPIAFEEFRSLYQKMRPILDPDFVQLAYDTEKRMVGYAFAYADLSDPTQLIFKTLVADSKMRASGLGVYLYDRIHWLAVQKGKKAVIHALMHEEHNSLKLSKSMGSVLYRSYALYTLYRS